MQRGSIRVQIGTSFVDVPMGIFSGALPLMTYNPTTGVFEGTAAASGGGDFVGPAGSVDSHLVLFNGTTGKLGKDTSPIVVTGGALAGVGSITAGGAISAPLFSGPATGLAETSGPSNLTVGAIPASGFLQRVAFGVVGVANSTFLPAGANTLFPGTWVAGDVPLWSGSQFDPKFRTAVQLPTAQTPASTTLANITGLAISLPRAGTYIIDGVMDVTVSVNPTTVAFGMNVSVAPTSMNVEYESILSATTVIGAKQTASLAVGGAGVASAAHIITTAAPTPFQGVVVASAACVLQMLASRSANVLTIGAQSFIRAFQI